jgi:hypothetical protein
VHQYLFTCVSHIFPYHNVCSSCAEGGWHFSAFSFSNLLQVLPISLRRSCLPEILKGLRDVENPKNWRHKHTLVEQLVTLCDLYDADYLHSHIYPVAKELMKDRVHEVRQSATQLLGMVLQRLTQITPDGYLPVLRDMRTEYASHKWWNFRQL